MQVIYSFEIGGSEMVARDLALGMKGCVIHGVAALEFDGPLRQQFVNEGIPTWVIGRQSNEYLGPMLRLWSAMRDFKPDVVHTHHLYQLLYAWPGALFTGARIIHTEHEYYSLMTLKARCRLHKLAHLCRTVTGVNEDTSKFLMEKVRISPRKVKTIVNGVNLERYGCCCLGRAALGLIEGNLSVGIVARLHPVKDHFTLLRAFRMVSDRLPQAKLLVIGDGPIRQQLEQLTSELGLGNVVCFLGARADVPDLLSCLDVVVLSSKEEGLPMSILEAMAAGKPVVATEVGGVPVVVHQNATGLLVPKGDSNAMAAALLNLLTDPDAARRMGKKGRELIEQHYDLRQTVASYRERYEYSMEG